MMDKNLDKLESRLEQLIQLCHQLKSENASLRDNLAASRREQARLYKKNKDAADQVRTIVRKLKPMTKS